MNDPEIKLILACSRVTVPPDIESEIRQCVSNISDWQGVLQVAAFHGMVPLLYAHLKRICPDFIAHEVMDQLKRMYVTNYRRNVSVTTALLQLLFIFQENGILAVPFKGPLLAEQAYGDVGLRQFSDLDILVKKKDAVKAQDLLVAHGYEAELTLSGKTEKKYLNYENSFSFYHRKGGPSIDLHWEMTGRYLLRPIHIEGFEKKLQYHEILNKKVFSIPDDILLIYLCVHGTGHCWEKLEWLCCFMEMVRRKGSEELDRIIDIAERMHCKRMLYLGLYLGNNLLGAALPDNVLVNIGADRGVVKYGEKVKKIIFHQKPTPNGDAKWRFHPLHIQIRDTSKDSIKYAIFLYTMPTIKEWVKCPLPPWLTPLYRIIRPLRLCLTVLFGRRTDRIFDSPQR